MSRRGASTVVRFFRGISTSNLCVHLTFWWVTSRTIIIISSLLFQWKRIARITQSRKEGPLTYLLQKMCKFWANLCMSLSSWRQNLRVFAIWLLQQYDENLASGWQQWLTFTLCREARITCFESLRSKKLKYAPNDILKTGKIVELELPKCSEIYSQIGRKSYWIRKL